MYSFRNEYSVINSAFVALSCFQYYKLRTSSLYFKAMTSSKLQILHVSCCELWSSILKLESSCGDFQFSRKTEHVLQVQLEIYGTVKYFSSCPLQKAITWVDILGFCVSS